MQFATWVIFIIFFVLSGFLSLFKYDQYRLLSLGVCSLLLDHFRPTHTHKAACRPSVRWFAHSPAPAHPPTPHVVSRVSVDRRHLSMCLVQFLLLLASPLLSSLPRCPAAAAWHEGALHLFQDMSGAVVLAASACGSCHHHPQLQAISSLTSAPSSCWPTGGVRCWGIS